MSDYFIDVTDLQCMIYRAIASKRICTNDIDRSADPLPLPFGHARVHQHLLSKIFLAARFTVCFEALLGALLRLVNERAFNLAFKWHVCL